MAERTHKKRPRDPHQLGKMIVDISVGEIDDHAPVRDIKDKDPAAVSLGRRGGLKGGPARAKRLSAVQRKNIATKAAKLRWAAHDKK